MGEHDNDVNAEKGIDYSALAEGSEQLREGMAALVAGLVVDGFDDKQARAIVAGAVGYWDKEDTNEQR